MECLKILTVADLHRNRTLYSLLQEAVQRHTPDIIAIVGDCLDATENQETKKFSTIECAQILSRLPCKEIVFVGGNHEDTAWWSFAEEWATSGRKLITLYGEAYIHGPLVLIGFPCLLGDETAFIGTREPLPADTNEWLPAVIKKIGPAARTLWLLHEPPRGTPLSMKLGPLAGNLEWNEAIQQFLPWVTISGHDHQSPVKNKRWHFKLEQTVCINVGQSLDGPLHYCLLEATFSKKALSLPTALRITAYPFSDSICLPNSKP